MSWNYLSGELLMSEQTGQPPESVVQPEHGESLPSAGTLLRQAREADGIHIAELALALKVSVKKLEALEADRLELLPDAVFVRALASSVCRTLKINATPILDRLPLSAVPRLELDGAGLNTPFQTPSDGAIYSIWNQLSKPVMLLALLLLAGALVLIFFPSMEQMLGAKPQAQDIAPAAQAAESAAPMAAIPDKPALVPEPPKAVQVAVAPKPQASKPLAVQGPVTASAIQSAASAPLIQPVQGRATTSGILVFKTQGPSWIEVTDAEGAVQIRRTIQEGEIVGVSGPLPLTVVIGRADMTEVLVRGKPFALAAITRDNVARFEVK
jgi:cytoskeleton protein RodZ